MKLVVGLGNPGEKYDQTWHNVGFLAVDELQKNGFSAWKSNAKHQVIGTEGNINGEKIILIKPQTFMNNSGQAVQAVANFYKIAPADIIVIHDELDLPKDKIKISHNASAAGHNGIKSIIDHLNSKEFIRIRLGIKPVKDMAVSGEKYVLKKIGLRDKLSLNKVIKDQVVPAVKVSVTQGVETAQNQFN